MRCCAHTCVFGDDWRASERCVRHNTYILKRFPTVEYEPELFPCITLSYKNATIRIFHTGKVILLGVRHVEQVSESLKFLSDAFFDYSLLCDFENFQINAFKLIHAVSF